MLKALEDDCRNLLTGSDCDAVALGVVDFSEQRFAHWQYSMLSGEFAVDRSPIYFDLASVSKPLTLSLGYFSQPEIVDRDMLLLLNHRAGLPAWGLLPKKGWQDIIRSYPIKKSETLYSDYSALRFMLEYNAKSKETIHQIARKTWDKEVAFWKDINADACFLQCGHIGGKPNYGVVHDPNARVIDDYVGHAGLFGTIQGVARTLLAFDQKFQLLKKVAAEALADTEHSRFQLGWDTVSDVSNTLAGSGCSPQTFGHLGFTGTSIWIDPDRKLGWILLTNAVKYHWYEKDVLNVYRRKLGARIWQSDLHGYSTWS